MPCLGCTGLAVHRDAAGKPSAAESQAGERGDEPGAGETAAEAPASWGSEPLLQTAATVLPVVAMGM